MPNPLEDNLGDILQKARQGKGWSLSRLARETGLDAKNLGRFEEGIQDPQPDQLTRLAHALGLHKDPLQDIAHQQWFPDPFPKEARQGIIPLKGYLGDYEVKGYLLFESESQEAALIDTAYNPDLVLKTLTERGLTLRAILLTHAHRDHIGGLSIIRSGTGAPVFLHPQELPLYRQQDPILPDRWAEEGLQIPLGRLTLEVLETPGHTPGGVTYYTGTTCFVGDALFAGSTGRSYSPEGYKSLLGSLRKKVLTLPGKTLLCPGHGPTTTVREELLHNPFFP
jgi:glyoxylase-like metal-dependent hydrolase (beta-lactamase superfamily II)